MSISAKLQDSTASFSHSELYQAFELLAPTLGFIRPGHDPIPEDKISRTTALTVPGFERLGTVLVRERTVFDVRIKIPSLIDRLLAGNLNPSAATYGSTSVVALAQTVIVSPPGFVDRVLNSTDRRDLEYFFAFNKEYGEWLEYLAEESAKKNASETSGNAPNSSSDSTTS